jgi:hypothetical protein
VVASRTRQSPARLGPIACLFGSGLRRPPVWPWPFFPAVRAQEWQGASTTRPRRAQHYNRPPLQVPLQRAATHAALRTAARQAAQLAHAPTLPADLLGLSTKLPLCFPLSLPPGLFNSLPFPPPLPFQTRTRSFCSVGTACLVRGPCAVTARFPFDWLHCTGGDHETDLQHASQAQKHAISAGCVRGDRRQLCVRALPSYSQLEGLRAICRLRH